MSDYAGPVSASYGSPLGAGWGFFDVNSVGQGWSKNAAGAAAMVPATVPWIPGPDSTVKTIHAVSAFSASIVATAFTTSGGVHGLGFSHAVACPELNASYQQSQLQGEIPPTSYTQLDVTPSGGWGQNALILWMARRGKWQITATSFTHPSLPLDPTVVRPINSFCSVKAHSSVPAAPINDIVLESNFRASESGEHSSAVVARLLHYPLWRIGGIMNLRYPRGALDFTAIPDGAIGWSYSISAVRLGDATA